MFQGKPILLIFYPTDFDYIAPSELMLMQKLKKNQQVVVVCPGRQINCTNVTL